MKIKLIAIAALLFAGTSLAIAKDHGNDSRGQFDGANAYSVTSRSRAEVIAKLEVWPRSALAELDNRDEPGAFSARSNAAVARYDAMRASAEFARRVQQIDHERGEAMSVAQPASQPVVR
ncbi:hypothetical protein [Ideonella sp. YS5]|uniref:hypothetical protein n=1 Tax=Ideonella sp. YS5 TaxID=3453714 RepID=UPI003EEB276A